MDRDATHLALGPGLIAREVTWASKYFTTGVWTGAVTGVSGAPGANQVKQWNDAARRPIEDVKANSDADPAAHGQAPEQAGDRPPGVDEALGSPRDRRPHQVHERQQQPGDRVARLSRRCSRWTKSWSWTASRPPRRRTRPSRPRRRRVHRGQGRSPRVRRADRVAHAAFRRLHLQLDRLRRRWRDRPAHLALPHGRAEVRPRRGRDGLRHEGRVPRLRRVLRDRRRTRTLRQLYDSRRIKVATVTTAAPASSGALTVEHLGFGRYAVFKDGARLTKDPLTKAEAEAYAAG
jgi:hypothetical protein